MAVGLRLCLRGRVVMAVSRSEVVEARVNHPEVFSLGHAAIYLPFLFDFKNYFNSSMLFMTL